MTDLAYYAIKPIWHLLYCISIALFLLYAAIAGVYLFNMIGLLQISKVKYYLLANSPKDIHFIYKFIFNDMGMSSLLCIYYGVVLQCLYQAFSSNKGKYLFVGSISTLFALLAVYEQGWDLIMFTCVHGISLLLMRAVYIEADAVRRRRALARERRMFL